MITENDEKILTIAKNLAEALQDYSYTRKDDDKKRVNELQFQLVQQNKK